MLNFFRKYQKICFVFVSIMVILSFSFFGTYNTFVTKEETSNRDIGKIIDGSILKERELVNLMKILNNGVEEGFLARNLLSDSFIHREIVLSGIGEILAKQYFSALKPELEKHWKQMKQYRTYMHPHVSFINAADIWKQYAPEINRLLQQLNESSENFSEENLSLIFALYNAQAKFPPHLLHQMLYFQQRQNEQIPFDPALPRLNPALFGFQSIEDWFGTKFIELVSQYIINAARLAEQQGYQVTKEETRLALLRNVYKGVEILLQGKEKPKMDEVQNYYVRQIRSLGLEEDSVIKIWNKVLSFQRLLDEVGEGVFIDSVALNQVKAFADSTWKVCQYSLPKPLQFADFRSMLKFQRYLEAIAENTADEPFLLPNKLKDIESIAKIYPELVCKSFEVQLAKIDQDQLAAQISLKQTWDWEKQEGNFVLLQQEFPVLATKKGENEEKRLQILDDLDRQMRLKIDQFARLSIVNSDREWLNKAIAKADYKNQILRVRLKGGKDPFSGEKFLKLLEKTDGVQQLSIDQVTYLLKVVTKGEKYELISFEEACEDETLDVLLDDLLKVAYEQMKIKPPFEEVKNEVGKKMYQDLISLIEKDTGYTYQDLNQYAKDRFHGYLKYIQANSKENRHFFETFPQEWRLHAEEIILSSNPQASLKEKEFSEIENGRFYQFLEFIEGKVDEKEISEIKNQLKNDAKKTLIKKILENFVEKDVIHLEML